MDAEISGGCRAGKEQAAAPLPQTARDIDARISALCQHGPTQRGTPNPAPLCRAWRGKARRTHHGDTGRTL